MQETWVQSLGLEDSLEKGMATHSSILAWGIPKTEKPGRVQSMEITEKLAMTELLNNNDKPALTCRPVPQSNASG